MGPGKTGQALASDAARATPSVELPTPISYGGFVFGTWRFRLRIFCAMRAIRRLDVAVAEGGRWHPPAPRGG